MKNSDSPSSPNSGSSLLWGAVAFFIVVFLFDPLLKKMVPVTPPGQQPTQEQIEAPSQQESKPSVTSPNDQTAAEPNQKAVEKVVENAKATAESQSATDVISHPEVIVVLEDDQRRFEITSLGASVKSLNLKINNTAAIRGHPFILLDAFNKDKPHFGVDVDLIAGDLLKRHWEVLSQTTTEAKFAITHEAGIRVEKLFRLREDYQLDVEVDVETLNSKFDSARVTLLGPCGLEEEEVGGIGMATYHAAGLLWGRRKNAQSVYLEISFSDLESRWEDSSSEKTSFVFHDDNDLGLVDMPLEWIGCRNKYFMVLMKSSEGLGGRFQALNRTGTQTPKGILAALSNQGSLDVQQSLSLKTTAYLGPRHKQTINKIDPQLAQTLQGNWLGPIQVVLLAILEWLYSFLSSYGIAIICLTLLVRVAIHPLTRRSQIKMQEYGEKMKALQPKLEALKKKHGNDRQAFAQAQMKLMRESKVTGGMLGGCLPMILQMPIFFSLYFMLQELIELRGTTFLWITDLSQPDRLFPLNFIVQDFNLLPLLTLAVTVIQMKRGMSRQTAMSPEQLAQQKFMIFFMPIIMLFFTYTFSAGLLLYWFTSALFGIFESELTRRHFLKQKTT